MTDVAIVIVTWNVCTLVMDAIRTLRADLATTPLTTTIYVVDSASQDNTVETIRNQFPDVHLIALEENVGFVKANNIAMRHIGFDRPDFTGELPKAVYLLNPDTLMPIGSTQILYDALMRQTDVGLVGARLAYGDDSFQHSAFRFPDLKQLWVEFFPSRGRWINGEFNGRYPQTAYEGTQPFDVDFVLGATMLLKREAIQQTGLFDEALFMYCEEIDWAKRIWNAKWRVQCVPTAKVIHLGGKSSEQAPPQTIKRLWQSRLYLFQKYYSKPKLLLAQWMIAFGMTLKMRGVAKNTPLYDAYASVRQQALN